MKRSILGIAAALVLAATGSARADFTLGFSDCPAVITGAPGETKVIHIFATLTSENLPLVDNANPPEGCPAQSAIGPQGWSFGVQADGADSATIDLSTVTVSTIFDNDAKCLTPPIDDPLQLDNAGFPSNDGSDVTHDPANPEVVGVTGAIVLSIKKQTRYLHPTGTERIADIGVTVTIPAEGADPKPVKLKFRDGLVGGGEPVPTVVTFNGKSNSPGGANNVVPLSVQECSFIVKAIGPEFNLALVGEDLQQAEVGDTILARNVTPGVPTSVTVLARLTTVRLPTVPVDNPAAGCPDHNDVGPQGWSFGVGHDRNCMTLDEVNTTFQGIQVPTLYDDDAKCATAAKDVLFDLGDSGFPSLDVDQTVVNLPGDPTVGGTAAAIVLSIKKQTRFLHPNTTDTLLKVVYNLPAVAENETKECRVYFLDGLVGSGEPVPTVVTFNGKSKSLAKGEVTAQNLIIRLTGKAPPAKSNFRRGDANNDSKLDIADAVTIVYAVVPSLGGPPLDCNDSGDADGQNGPQPDLADAVYIINYEFLAGPPPVAPGTSCGTSDSSNTESCPPDSTSCP